MTTLFISDLHIDAHQPQITERFLKFVATECRAARALYILGDLFETWIGDDDPDPDQKRVIAAIKTLTESARKCFVMCGNRDFLFGPAFCASTGAQLLPDPVILTIEGTSVLLMHGDALCTDDRSYQRLRATVRDANWQRSFLALTVRQRRALAQAARAGSQAHMAGLEYGIVDVNPSSVETAFREAQTDVLLHGHTHRPGVHRLRVDGRECTRIVLGAWYDQGSVLAWDRHGFELRTLSG